MHRAVIDKSGIYRGHKALARGAKPKAGDVMVPDDCDLGPGKYRWDGRTFQPIVGVAPDLATAICEGFRAVEAQGTALPDATTAWLRWWEKRIAAKGGG